MAGKNGITNLNQLKDFKLYEIIDFKN